MASHGYMIVEGESQGLISAGCSSTVSIGSKCQAGHEDEIMVLSFDHNMNNQGNIKHATHNPIFITKPVDKSSPLLAQALANREKLTCTLNFYRHTGSGGQDKFYSVKIKGAQIADLTVSMPHSILHNDAEPQEIVALRYRDIIWEHHTANTSGYTSWNGGQWDQ
jgi:type VI secretion system Hcp family effector